MSIAMIAILGQIAIVLSISPSDGSTMSKGILIRNVPESIRSWVHSEKARLAVGQQEFMISLLEDVRRGGRQLSLFDQTGSHQPMVERNSIPFTFVDLFAGIGGFRLALESLGGNCLFTSEYDKFSKKTYRAWYGDTPDGDITKIRPADIPDHDVLAAGFPCQPFSIAA